MQTETLISHDEHLEWCKQRAREYLANGDAQGACDSMLSDLGKHPETRRMQQPAAMMAMVSSGSVVEARKFIEGFSAIGRITPTRSVVPVKPARDLLSQAVLDGTVTFEQARDVREKAGRHHGGRPRGVRNSGPSKLEQAVSALAAKRSEMTAEEVAESERRMDAMVSKRWNWKSYKVRREAIRAGALAEEISVLLAYKRSEDRVGMSRQHRAKGIHRAGGWVFGYKTEPETIVEFNPLRWRQGGRRWLAPINDDGSNGMTLDNAGVVAEPTIGELHKALLECNRVRGSRPYEPD